MSYEEKFVASENKVLYGNILIKGTKISLGTILRELSEGKSTDKVINSHPEISANDIYMCLEYAAELVGAIDLKKSIATIEADRKKRKGLADKFRMLKDKPFIFKDENGNIIDVSKL
jgi:uncharacterized protein (DUF433 family)